jgi:hypothetical protein
MKREIINSGYEMWLASRKGMIAIRELQSASGEDFPGETFRVLKEKEVRLYGDASHRTSRLVLEAWDKLSTDGNG